MFVFVSNEEVVVRLYIFTWGEGRRLVGSWFRCYLLFLRGISEFFWEILFWLKEEFGNGIRI